MTNTKAKKSPVTLIGLGPMGQAMAGALLEAGYELTVWNRTKAKAEALAERGAAVADSPAEALRAGGPVLLSLTEHAVMYRVLEGAESDLKGRTILNLGSDTPAASRAAAAWAEGHGARYVTGGVMSPAPGIGSSSVFSFYSGDRAAFEENKALLEVLTATDFRGEDPGLAQVYYQILLDLFWTTMTGYLHALAVARAEGVPVGTITPYLIEGNDMAMFFEGTSAAVAEGRFPGDEDRISMDAASMEHVVQTSRDAGVDTALPEAVLSLFRRGLDAGFAESSFARLVTLMDAEG
ncbi:NAD(P)-dependent oxidoreductase [Nocardiopsis halophila]|uniref:Imine reductase n=1 Tax=Nocardiopsis halophila TaxID=141692 RepID=A0A0J9X1X6_9ACTN|nr:NAD(P)-binding domain-containing protein [Nocardiopsis halophila]4D3S_A Chain A, IMINE REDUCTASE [Nocardiopsis halophila]4D3S_B Chain B, IMINE REDUCTASE [Nocardiopsis halophila]4D3S_C Chain C, IMINE REDUCTASE [Nocardiopsis halophila]4D3S_D Chain D, IMINE REDUCTASE [Nocardiopsis halophila]4D3S_E Chain E, IMINE REDUCTASE [Nocardiopsis halophila]4D3S_F Chain F, IMINE REDUCTASE [Nocardiopsis halophila]4D3S_G Chain G, IMINE REDUCTASE [Nocardiopsis halophila]4D3S_H Chain H, IMINE REDUCTASE [No